MVELANERDESDVSGQMASYSTVVRRKTTTEAILGTPTVDARFVFKNLEETDIFITEFRVCNRKFTYFVSEQDIHPKASTQNLHNHVFTESECKACKENIVGGCYKKKQEGLLEKSKVKRVTTYITWYF